MVSYDYQGDQLASGPLRPQSPLTHHRKLVVRNTFLEFEDANDEDKPVLRRSSSGSNISSGSAPLSQDDLRSMRAKSNIDSEASRISKRERFKNIHVEMRDDLNTWVNEGFDTPHWGDDNAAETCQPASSSNQWIPTSSAPNPWIPPAPPPESAEFVKKLFNCWLVAKEENSFEQYNKMMDSMAEAGELQPHVAKDQDGNPVSLGSILHGERPVGESCKPCIFFAAKRCMLNELCLHCHFHHPEAKKTNRASKSKRDRMARAKQREKAKVTMLERSSKNDAILRVSQDSQPAPVATRKNDANPREAHLRGYSAAGSNSTGMMNAARMQKMQRFADASNSMQMRTAEPPSHENTSNSTLVRDDAYHMVWCSTPSASTGTSPRSQSGNEAPNNLRPGMIIRL